MGSVRDPGRDQMEAEELARAKAAARQAIVGRKARRARERRLKGNPAARLALAKDYAAVNDKERRRADRG